MNTAELLRKIYYDPSNSASFGSVDKLYRKATEINPFIKRNDVEKFLSGEFAYTLHRRIVRKYERNPVVANFHTELAQADLIDVARYARENDGHRYILTLLDVFSKYAYAVPLKSKAGADMARALETIFHTYRPCNLQTDEGTEFTCSAVQKLLKEHMVNFYLAKNENIKAAVVERFQRTLMSRVHKYFTSTGKHRFLDVLPDFLSSYNNTFHTSLRMTPSQACVADTSTVFMNLYGCRSERELLKQKARAKYDAGVTVRIPKHKNVFEKGYRQNFTDQIYKVKSANTAGKRATYKLMSHDNKVVPGSFYHQELQKVADNNTFRVEVLARRKRGRVKQVKVRYINFTDVAPEWISETNLQSLS